MDGDRTPNETPTNRLEIAQEDLDRIAKAIRDGLGKQPPDGKKLLWDIVRVVGAFVLLVLVYLVLTNWRPAVDITFRADAVSTPQVLTHDPEEGFVKWSLGTGQVKTLNVEELRETNEFGDEFMISLPIPRSECAEVAAELDAPCDDGVIEVRVPVTVAWSDPQVLRLERDPVAEPVSSEQNPAPQELRLDLKQPSASPAGMAREASDESAEQPDTPSGSSTLPDLTISDRQIADQQWSFTYQTSSAATLSISGGDEGYERPFEPASAQEFDGDALRLRVVPGAATESEGSQDSSSAAGAATGQASGTSARAHSVVTLSGVSSLDLNTESVRLNTSALAGSLRLLQETRVLDGAAPTGFTGELITSDLEIRSGTPSLAIRGTEVTSIDAERGNLVSTVWQRHSDLALPIFIGVVGVFTPLLGTAYRNGVDFLAARRTRPAKPEED